MADDELERFKRDIDLIDYAMSQGYVKDKKRSSKNSITLKAGAEELVFTKGRGGHYLYWNKDRQDDCGTIIDFVKNRVGDNNVKLVRVRQELRSMSPQPGSKKTPIRLQSHGHSLAEISKDLTAVIRQAASFIPYIGSYLTRERKLDAETIKACGVLQGAMGNAIFLHTDSDGSVTGWEAKNQGFTGFSDGGQRLLYVARPDPDLPVSRIVITEAAIDALSYAQMYDVPGAIYVSTAGAAMSAEQKQQIVELVNSNESAEIVLASDNDEGGHKMAASIQALLPEVPMVRELSQTKDWNEDLKARAGDSGQNSTAKNVVSRP